MKSYRSTQALVCSRFTFEISNVQLQLLLPGISEGRASVSSLEIANREFSSSKKKILQFPVFLGEILMVKLIEKQ